MRDESDYLIRPENQRHLKVMEVLRRWDPIGVISDTHQDEYDGYSGGFVRMLDAGATVDEIVERMREIVTISMGMSCFDRPHSRDCAEEMIRFWQSSRVR